MSCRLPWVLSCRWGARQANVRSPAAFHGAGHVVEIKVATRHRGATMRAGIRPLHAGAEALLDLGDGEVPRFLRLGDDRAHTEKLVRHAGIELVGRLAPPIACEAGTSVRTCRSRNSQFAVARPNWIDAHSWLVRPRQRRRDSPLPAQILLSRLRGRPLGEGRRHCASEPGERMAKRYSGCGHHPCQSFRSRSTVPSRLR